MARALSTAASALIIAIALAASLSGLYVTTANAVERVADAGTSRQEATAARIGTTINITDASWDLTASNLTVKVNNTGDRVLDASAVDTVVDGRFVGFEDYERTEVDGRQTTVWRPGEQLVLEDEDTVLDYFSTPNRVKVVSGPGVAFQCRI
ncbi:MAG: hypothetical protein ABEH64_07985 [Salinirussus sp.]